MSRATPPIPEDTASAPSKATAVALATALVTFSKALKALSFYPAEHPRRAESSLEAFRQLASLTSERELSLLVRREGLAPADRPAELLTAQSMTSLARDLLTRRIKQLHFLPTLRHADLQAFLELLASDPATMGAAGSMEALMATRRIETICINEIDLATVMQTHLAPGNSAADVVEGEGPATAELEQDLGSLASLIDES
ncbi:MAG TPA: hypothetical protein VIU41_06790, partial [Geobacteraceae bacterium]